MTAPRLITLSGLPGVGKTTVARVLARSLPAQHLRIDTIEAAMARRGFSFAGGAGDAGYVVAYALARDALALGASVVVDAVHGWPGAPDMWQETATVTGARLFCVELVCSDLDQHRARVETRLHATPGGALPDWSAVRSRAYATQGTPDLRLDTARLSPDEASTGILKLIRRTP